MIYAHPTSSEAQRLYAWAQRLVDDLNRYDGPATGQRVVTADVAVAKSDYFIEADASAGPVTVTIPASPPGRNLVIKKIDSTGNAVTLTGDDTIDGAATYVLSVPQMSISLIRGAGQWRVV